jgi:hypothetical protein
LFWFAITALIWSLQYIWSIFMGFTEKTWWKSKLLSCSTSIDNILKKFLVKCMWWLRSKLLYLKTWGSCSGFSVDTVLQCQCWYLTNIKHFPCWYTVISTRVETGKTRNCVETRPPKGGVVSHNFSEFSQFPRVFQYGKNVLYLFYNIAQRNIKKESSPTFPCWHWVISTRLLANQRSEFTNAILYIEDITRWREDMTFISE